MTYWILVKLVFHVEIENVGQEASGDLLINLSHDGTMINVLSDDLTHTSVDPGELATVGPFDVEVGWNIDDGSVAPIIVTVSEKISSGNMKCLFHRGPIFLDFKFRFS